jgi:hypothetical protein
MLRDTVQHFTDAEITPRAAGVDAKNLFPADQRDRAHADRAEAVRQSM